MRIARLPKASVAVHVNGRALQEYEAESEDPMTATSYVETVNGAEFSVVLKLDRGFRPGDKSLAVNVSLDGSPATGLLIRENELKMGITQSINKMVDEVDGVSCYRMFTFAQHKSTDGKPDPSLISRLSRIGEVTVTIWRCRETGAYSKAKQKFKALGEKGIPEKALKGRAVSCHATLGRVETASQIRPSHIVSYESRPIANYTFRYRSRRDLEIEAIIKSRPLLPIEDQDPDDLTPEEARELVRRMRAQKDTAANIKPERKLKPENRAKRQHSEVTHGEDGDDDEVSITSVVALNTKRARTAGPSSIEVLDLTGE